MGSSASTSAGRLASARATATRCCSPPESWLGRWVRRSPRPSAVSRSRRARVGIGARGAVDQLRQHDILDRVEIGQQMVELIDEAEPVAARPRCGRAVEQLRGFLAGDADRAVEPALEQADRLQQGRLARARRAEQRDDLAGLHIADRRRAAPRSSRRPDAKLRFSPRVWRTGSLIAQHLHRIGARRLPRRIERGEEREQQGDHARCRSSRTDRSWPAAR